jgi:hypothetical protein
MPDDFLFFRRRQQCVAPIVHHGRRGQHLPVLARGNVRAGGNNEGFHKTEDVRNSGAPVFRVSVH